MNRTCIVLVASLVLLSACEKTGQSAYKESELGVSRAVEFGTIIDVKEVKVVGDTNDTGALIGGGAGLAGGSQMGTGSGNLWSDLGGAVVGGVVGNYIEQQVRNTTGYQYILNMQNGDVKTITLAKKDGDELFKSGDKVMMQYCDMEHSRKCKSGEVYQRLIKVDKFPPKPHDAKKHHRHDDDDDDDEKQ